MKKISWKIVITVLIIAIIIILVILKINHDNKYNYEIETVKDINYVLIMENGKYGVINRNGEIVVNPDYDSIQIPNPSKAIFICMNNYNEETQQYTTFVVNDSKQILLHEYEHVEAIKINNTSSTIPYEKTTLKYKENGKYGIIDFDGKKITKAIYEEVSSIDYKEGMLLVKENGKYGVINIKGTSIIKCEYDSIECDGYYSNDTQYQKAGFKVCQITNEGYRYGYINYEGKEILKTEYNQLERIITKQDDDNIYFVAFKNGRAALIKNKEVIISHEYEDIFYYNTDDLVVLQKNSKQGVADLQGNIIIPIEYDNIYMGGKYINAQKNDEVKFFDSTGKEIESNDYISIGQTTNENYAIVINKNDNYGVIDNNNNNLIKEEYQYLEYAFDNYFIAEKNNKYGIITEENKVVVDFEYDTLQVINNTKVIQGIVFQTNITDLYDKDINKITSLQNANIYFEDNYIKAYTDNDINYYDIEGNSTLNTQIYTNELYAIKQNSKWGFADKDGKIIVEPMYDMVTEYNEYGFAGIKKNGKWGSIDKSGNVIVEPMYTIVDNLPEFIGEYYKVDLGYGQPYYTK